MLQKADVSLLLISAVSAKQAVELAKYAENLGYDAVSSVAPFYYKFSFDEIRITILPLLIQSIFR